MNDIKLAAAMIMDGYDEEKYPKAFLNRFERLECLSDRLGIETYLVKEKSNDCLYIAKCYEKDKYPGIHEKGILNNSKHHGIPSYLEEYRNEYMICIIREYVTGLSLDLYRKKHGFTQKAAVEVCVGLCDILTCLHEQEPPIIHRDIKPQNIIVKPDGSVCLIDFDIARFYRTDANTDTEFIGTRAFAPPEQYGFSQSGPCADIYATGVVFGWLLTGATDQQDVLCRLGDTSYARIYKRCTAFSPNDRYATARLLKSALLHAEKRNKKKVLHYASIVSFCLALFFIGFLTGQLAPVFFDRPSRPSKTVFTEPLIEQAVRLQLGKTSGERITREDLLSVTSLYIFGSSLVAANEAELHEEAKRLFDCSQMQRGTIRSLADLTKMPGLKQVFVCMQSITDIAPLAGLAFLEVVDIKNNPITDLAPLSHLPLLKRIAIYDTRVTDLSPLSLCIGLEELDAGNLPITSFADLAGLERLKTLRLSGITFQTIKGIETFAELETLTLENVIDGDLTPLFDLPELRLVTLGDRLFEKATKLSKPAGFTVERIPAR